MQASNPTSGSGPAGTQKKQVTSYSVKPDGSVSSLGMSVAELKATPAPAKTQPAQPAKQPAQPAKQPANVAA